VGCLIPADVFYEWQKTRKGPKQPVRAFFLNTRASHGNRKHTISHPYKGKVRAELTITFTKRRTLEERLKILSMINHDRASKPEEWINGTIADQVITLRRLSSITVNLPASQFRMMKLSRSKHYFSPIRIDKCDDNVIRGIRFDAEGFQAIKKLALIFDLEIEMGKVRIGA
jgi:hypothetical protein